MKHFFRLFFLISALLFAGVALAQMPANFQKKEIIIGDKKLIVEIAKSDDERAQGLMFRKFLPDNYGMLFIFEYEKELSFWMKNTYIPLSIGFLDKNKVVVDIQDMKPMSTGSNKQDLVSYRSKKPAQYALEVNQGWFKKNKIKIGDRAEF